MEETNCKSETVGAAISTVEAKIIELEQEQTKAALYRSRYKWASEGEKMTKYYFSLEKKNYTNKTMFTVINKNGKICTEQKEILKEQELFYRELYTKNENVSFKISNKAQVTVSVEQNKMLTRDITMEELYSSLKSMKLEKVPGCDGLGPAFYIKFYDELKSEMWTLYSYILEHKKLNASARKGVISLIPKAGKDTRYLQHQCPLTMLCTDYKILAKTLANTLKSVLPDIVGPEQTGFMEKRSIHQNIRRAMDVVARVNEQKTRAVIVTIDFHKCFDMIEHESMFAPFNYFGFADKFISWVKIFFKDFVVCTENAGYTSDFFQKTRGVNQGCNISPFCFNVCGAVMKELIINNPKIVGIKLSDNSAVREVISQFADDTALFLVYNETCINEAIKMLSHVERNLGLRISYEKTCIYRIGSLKDSEAKCYTVKPLMWSDDDIQLLGVTIVNGKQDSKCFDSTIDKMYSVMQCWQNRNATLMGKTLLINTLMGSLFVYKMSVIPKMTMSQQKRVHAIINEFLWKGKKAKIPIKVLQNVKHKGGLKLTNLVIRHDALIMQWIPKILLDEQWAYVHEWLANQMGKKIWECNISSTDCAKIIGKNNQTFWHNVLLTWCKYHYYEPQTQEEILEQIIWYNSHLRVNNKVLVPKNKWVPNSEIMYISDIVDDFGRPLPYIEVKEKFATELSWLQYYNVISSIPPVWRAELVSANDFAEKPKITLERICGCAKPSQYIYNFLIENVYNESTDRYAAKWFERFGITTLTYDDYYKYHKNIVKITKVTKLRDFQYRLLLNKIFTNDLLYKWGKVESPICEHCNDIQTPIHLLCLCDQSKNMWKYVKTIVKCETDVWSPEAIIFNTVVEKPEQATNLLVLICKQFIFQQKCLGRKPNRIALAKEITAMYNIEKRMSILNNKRDKFEKKLEKCTNLIVSLLNTS